MKWRARKIDSRKGISTLILVLLLSLVRFGATQRLITRSSIAGSAVSGALDYLRTVQQYDGSISNFAVSCWAVMAVSAAGEDPHSWEGGSGYSIVDYLILNKGTVNLSMATDVERFILSMTAADEDPRNIGGMDYISALKTLFTNGQIGSEGLLNDDFFGVLALTSAGEPTNSTIIQGSVSFLKENQNDDGGWGFGVSASSDVDMTSAAIMALIAAGEENSTSIIVNATGYLRESQRPNGGFPSWGEVNSASDSWAISAICSIGQNPFLWEVSGINVVEHLLTLQNVDGSFNWTRNDPVWIDKAWYTSYAIVSLCLQPYPVNGMLINLRIQGSKTTFWSQSVFVASSIIRDDQGLEHYIIDVVALGALDKASEIGGFNYEVIQTGGGLKLLAVAGERESTTKYWVYRVNLYSPDITPDRFVWNTTSPPEPPHLELAFYVEVSPLGLGGGAKSPLMR